MKKIGVLAFSLAVVLIMTGCAKPPENLLLRATAALQAAQNAGAAKYAPDAWATAQQALDKLKAELAAQAKKFSLFRSYAQARALGEAALKAADRARDEALAQKKLAGDAQTAVVELRRLLQSARSQLAALPRTSRLDVAGLRTMLDGASRQLDRAQTDLTAGRFDEAMATASQARGTVAKVLTTIEKATGRPASKKR
jgi:hypothetical protein